MGQLGVLLAIMAGLIAFTDIPERVQQLFEDSIRAGQEIATAGDLRSMSNMLDYHYIRKGRYPREDRFEDWLATTFQNSNIKKLSLDHWGNPYVYEVGARQKSYVLISMGEDGIIHTDDDMKVTGP